MNPFLEFILFLVFSAWLLAIIVLVVRAADFGYLNFNNDSPATRVVMLMIAGIMLVVPLLILNWLEGGLLF